MNEKLLPSREDMQTEIEGLKAKAAATQQAHDELDARNERAEATWQRLAREAEVRRQKGEVQPGLTYEMDADLRSMEKKLDEEAALRGGKTLVPTAEDIQVVHRMAKDQEEKAKLRAQEKAAKSQVKQKETGTG